ncbi:transposase [Streptomyces sp. enrichment culture]|uniref:transposase n=1 Tax=Streptomyces sp. enrichment culture TaxID=1795815 RepID=UPI003F54C624
MSVDSAICRAHRHAAGARKRRAADPGRPVPGGLAAEPDDHALGRSRGGPTTKIHLAVDASSHVLAAVVTTGQRSDAPVFTEVMDRIGVPCTGGGHPRARPAHVLADRACSSRRIRSACVAGRSRTPFRRSVTRPATAFAGVRPAAARPAPAVSDTGPDTKSNVGLGSSHRPEASRRATENSPSATLRTYRPARPHAAGVDTTSRTRLAARSASDRIDPAIGRPVRATPQPCTSEQDS